MGELVDLALAARDMVAHGWFGALRDDEYVQRGSIPHHCVVTALGELALSDPRAWSLRELCLEVLGISESEGAWIPLRHVSATALVDWNNHPDRTQEEVINMFDDVARLAKDRELGEEFAG